MSAGSTPLSTTPSSSPYNAYFKRRSFGRPFKDDVTCIYEPPSPPSSNNSSPSSSRSPSPTPSSPPPLPSTSTSAALKGKSKSTSPTRDAIAEKERMLKALRREERRRRREEERRRRPSILTVRMSEGFIWNQDLFVPPHIRDRYNTTSSPPTLHGFSSPAGSAPSQSHMRTSSTSAGAAYGSDYEVECVDIRVEDGEMEEILHPAGYSQDYTLSKSDEWAAPVTEMHVETEKEKELGPKKVGLGKVEEPWMDSMGWDMELDVEEVKA